MSLIRLLASPELVAHFQIFCGLEEDTESGQLNFNPVVHRFMKFGSTLVGEQFVTVWTALQSWWINVYVSRQVIMPVTLVVVAGQCIKDILKLPRPSYPPAIKLEKKDETDYGTPSIHTALAGSFASALILFEGGNEISMRQGLLLATLYTSYVGISRIYVGVHSFLDVILGGVLSIGIVYVSHENIREMHDTLLGSERKTLVYAGCMFAIAAVVFKIDNEVDPIRNQKRWSTGKGDACRALAMNAGFIVGSHLAIRNDLYQTDATLLVPTSLDQLKTFISRMAVGVVMRFLMSYVIKKSFLSLFSTLFGIPLTHKAEAIKKEPLELFYKFFATFTILFTASTLVPYAFHVLKI